MKFKRKLLPIIVALAIVCCLFGGIFGVDGAETQVARAEETISIYAETGESIAQGNTGYCYVYVDNTVALASLTVAVHYDSQKMSVTGYYNQVSCSIYDASNNDGCLKSSYIFDAEGSETKTALFYFYYQINSDAEIGDTGFDVVVEEAYTTTLEVAPYSGSRCSFDITEKKVVNTCSVYGTSTINTSVKETFEIDYSLSNCYIASGSIDVKYDPELFEFVELTQGNFLNGKVVDVNSSQRGTISLSFLATEYNYYSDLVKVKFRTLKNETTTSQIQLQVNDLYNLELSPFSCSGYTTDVNVTFDSVYAEDAPSVILGASFLESTEQVLVTVLLEEGSRLGAGDFVLNFDTEDIEFVSYEKGFTPSFFNVNDKSVADGVLKFSVISMTDIVDEQTVLTILFNAKRECVNKTSNITISGTGLTDSLTNGILLNFVDTTANIPLKHSPAASVEEVTKAPTCTSKGSYDDVVYCSICEAELSRQSNVLDALGHDLTPHDSKKPTCTEIGWNTYVTCSRCDHTTYQEIPATGHTESAVVVENNVAPTCTATGSYDNVVYCATCDTELSRTTITVDALGHDIINHEEKAPTCTDIGWSAYVTCSRCEYTTYEEKSALGHEPVEHSAKAPTCTEIGWNAYVTCSRCDHTTYEEKSALGHDPVEYGAKAPTCTEIGWNAYVTCSRCDHTTYQELPATGHSHNAVVTAPTCTEQGYTTHTCHCGDEYIDSYVDALGHDIINHEEKAPTCTQIGWNAYVTCSRCDHTTYAEIPATGHSHNAVVTAPTCTAEGYTTYTCHCGDTFVADKVAALGHTESEAVVENTVDPTCTTDGSYDTVVYCGVCFEELSRDNHSISKLGHAIVSHNAQAPTCTEIGWDKYETCSRCDYTTYTEIPATGHTESAVVVENNVAPTCTATGSYDNVVYCATCDAELSRDEIVVPALGHDLIPHDSKAPTCTAIGWNTYVTCSRCDHTTYQEITATGHKDSNNDKLCDVCDASLCDVHTPSENLAFDEEGHWSVCSVCGYALEKVEHTYETATTAPTCLEQGYTTFTCHCGHSYKSNFVDALGHELVEHSAKAPTCTDIGWSAYVTCSRCDYTTYAEIPATGHTESAVVVENNVAPTCTVTGSYDNVMYCATCDAELSRDEIVVPALGHDLIPHDSKEPTCTAIGWNTYVTCSRCDYTTYQELPATGHSHNTVVTAPTCTEQGYTTHTCHCGDSYIDSYVGALGHEEVIDRLVDPTCTATGLTEGSHCSVCDEILVKQEVVAALGHDEITHNAKAPACTEIGWNAYVTCSRCDHTTYAEIPATGHSHNAVVTAPTCTEQGYTTHTCHCGDEYTDSYVDALGHDAIPHDSKAPTCTEIGWNEYETCSRCDYTTYTEIPATGHTPAKAVIENMVSATCLQAGEYDSVVYCATCGEEVSRQAKTILALGHYIIHNAGKEATCTEDGWDAYDTCARCDYSTYKVVSALGHDLIPHDSKAPTCTEIGWNTYVNCSRCDHTTYAEIPATGHTPESVVVENNDVPTCTATGSYDNVVYCATCDAELSRTTITVDALGHDIINHEEKAPTCTEIGWSAYVTCSRCDHTTYAEIPATGHSTTSHEAKEPTCTETGWNAYVTCDKCDYTTYEELAKTPHIPSDAVKENVVESTTETEGHYDSVVYCSVCGHEISREQKTTPIISDANISDPDSGEKGLGVGEIAAIATTTSASATGGIAALVSFILKRRKIKIKK